MTGTIFGGLNAAITNKARHGDDHYKKIGKIGGQAQVAKGFSVIKFCECDTIDGIHIQRYCAAKRGGMKSRRVRKKR